MDPIEDLLRGSRHAPPATSAGLADVTRRGRRRRDMTRAAVASSGLAVVVAGAVFLGAIADAPTAVVSSGASPSGSAAPTGSPVSEPPLVVVGTVSWSEASVSPDGESLTVSYSAGSPKDAKGCQHRVRVRSEETADSVTITLETVVPSPKPAPEPSHLCQARLYHRTDTVVLRSPLGDRRVIDGSNGAERRVAR